MPERIYVNVNSDFDSTGYMLPRSITWKNGKTFKIESVKDYRPASAYRKGMQGDCYTVVIKGETRHLFFEKTDNLFATRVNSVFITAERELSRNKRPVNNFVRLAARIMQPEAGTEKMVSY